MKVAIIGSRNIIINNLYDYIPNDVTEIVSGGAKGVDLCAKEYAQQKKIKYTEFLPEYNKYGKYAPLKRNLKIIEYSDEIYVFWDGVSPGTKYVVSQCEKSGKTIHITII